MQNPNFEFEIMEEGLKVFNEIRDRVIASGLTVIPFENGMMQVGSISSHYPPKFPHHINNHMGEFIEAAHGAHVALELTWCHGSVILITMFSHNYALKQQYQPVFDRFCSLFQNAIEYVGGMNMMELDSFSVCVNDDNSMSRLESMTLEYIEEEKRVFGKVALAWSLYEEFWNDDDDEMCLWIEFIVYE
jgi:hypothetical protein